MYEEGIRIVLDSVFISPVSAQQNPSELGNWYIYFGNKKLNDKWNIHHEVQYRNYNMIGDIEQLLLRAGVGYNLTENNNKVLLGYGYILSSNYISVFSDEKLDVKEHRIYQQFITKQSFSRFNIANRYRFEERFVNQDFKFRFRYFLAVKMALTSRKMENKTLYLSGCNEIFLNGTSSIFDRNRLYGGLGYKVSSNLSFELGYMNQFFDGAQRDQLNVIMSFSF